MKLETDKIADSMNMILSRLDQLEKANEELKKKNDDLEFELERLKIERQDELAAFAEEVSQRTLRTAEARKEEDEKICRALFATIAPNVNFESAVRIGKIRHE